ncbi:hypothetical protein AB0M28_05390 [Streptomyces sp. NPDC051940]|uniref:hypothetical protein n=1 Tax=Streptomyces sp. NPDC051940 TaxID=3155675 RepID=UPI003434A543
MRIHLSARTRSFTVLGNDVLRDNRLSFTARGLLAYLLSLPDGSREDVRTLADNHPHLGRRGVAKAMNELIAAGYYHRVTDRDPDTGYITTWTYVSDVPRPTGSPLPLPAGTGDAADGQPGTSPTGLKTRDEKPPTPPPAATKPESPEGWAGEAPERPTRKTPEAEPEPTPEQTRAAALLTRITATEPRLTLAPADALTLAPLAATWVDHGCTEPELRAALTSGLPRVIHSPRHLLANRLTRKLPKPRLRRDPAAPATPLPECAECRDPLPRNQPTGICSTCAGITPTATPTAPALSVSATSHAAALRRTLPGRRIPAPRSA